MVKFTKYLIAALSTIFSLTACASILPNNSRRSRDSDNNSSSLTASSSIKEKRGISFDHDSYEDFIYGKVQIVASVTLNDGESIEDQDVIIDNYLIGLSYAYDTSATKPTIVISCYSDYVTKGSLTLSLRLKGGETIEKETIVSFVEEGSYLDAPGKVTIREFDDIASVTCSLKGGNGISAIDYCFSTNNYKPHLDFDFIEGDDVQFRLGRNSSRSFSGEVYLNVLEHGGRKHTNVIIVEVEERNDTPRYELFFFEQPCYPGSTSFCTIVVNNGEDEVFLPLSQVIVHDMQEKNAETYDLEENPVYFDLVFNCYDVGFYAFGLEVTTVDGLSFSEIAIFYCSPHPCQVEQRAGSTHVTSSRTEVATFVVTDIVTRNAVRLFDVSIYCNKPEALTCKVQSLGTYDVRLELSVTPGFTGRATVDIEIVLQTESRPYRGEFRVTVDGSTN